MTTQTVVSVSGGTLLSAANQRRRYLLITNIGTGLVTLGFGSAATAGQGTPLTAASASGDQGGFILWESVGGTGFVPGEDIYGTGTSTVVVVEG